MQSPGRRSRPGPRDDGRPLVGRPVRVFSQLGVRLPADLGARLKAFSLRSGQSLNTIVASALERYLEREESARPGE